MAVPKCKVSKARRDKRRGSNWKLSAPSVAVCPKCGEPVMPHRACKACGTYNGRQVLAAKADSGRKSKRKALRLPLFPCYEEILICKTIVKTFPKMLISRHFCGIMFHKKGSVISWQNLWWPLLADPMWVNPCCLIS